MEDVLERRVVDGYAGDVTPEEAFEMLCSEAGSVLVDVRTNAEWTFVGRPDLGACGKAPLLVEWQRYPDMAVNETFAAEVEAGLDALLAREGPARESKDCIVLFLCRSGVRSVAAARAMAAQGYTKSFNVTQGFEGDLDGEGHRGVGGWKAQGLHWSQR